MSRIDLHTHSAVSDGTDSPTQLVQHASDSGLDVIALTDHDTFDGIDEALEAGKRVGVKVVPGLELSCEHRGASVHLLGYWCDRRNRDLLDELRRNREGRSGRVAAMAARLTALGMPMEAADIMAAAKASPSIGRPHVADAMIAKGYVTDRDEAFARWLGDGLPAHITRYSTPVGRGIDLVHGAGGVAVLAHPWGRGRADDLPAEDIEALVVNHGLDGLEVDHQDHDAATRSLLSALAVRLGLVRTGSSDHHGLGKTGHDLGCNTTRPTAYRELRRLARARAAQS